MNDLFIEEEGLEQKMEELIDNTKEGILNALIDNNTGKIGSKENTLFVCQLSKSTSEK